MNFPTDFIFQTENLLKDDAPAFFDALKTEPPVSIRLNPAKASFHLPYESVLWCENGFYLPERPSFTFDPLFHAGCYYPQEASSMFVGYVIGQFLGENSRILDLCAAPGGKSTHVLSLLKEDDLLVSNEVIRSRANILSENVIKSGYNNVVVTNNDPADFDGLKHYFDIVLVDAPCSGEGMFRKDKGAIEEWSVDNVKLCRDRQRRIVSDVWDALKPGGIMVYSTCTYNLSENEENVEWICSELGAETVALNLPPEWNVTASLKKGVDAFRFLPHKTKGEGFFLAVLRKNDDENLYVNKIKKEKTKIKQNLSVDYQDYVKERNKYSFIQNGNEWIAFPHQMTDDLSLLKNRLRVVSFGTAIGEEKGKDFIPAHSLALSNIIDTNLFSIYDADWHTAIAYLRKEALVLPVNQPKGFILLTYKNKPLGFIKNLGNRANNLYPQEWRIRSSNLPESFKSFL